MRRPGVPPCVLALAFAAACDTEPDPDFRLPWWPSPHVAAPSPLLDALGLAPPELAGPGCHRGGGLSEGDEGVSAGLTRLAIGFETTCIFPVAGSGGHATIGAEAVVSVDGRGAAWRAQRSIGQPSARAAALVADSIVRRGLALPGARPLTCRMEGWSYMIIRSDGVEPTVRGWQAPAYQALVLAHPERPDSAGPHVVDVRVSRAPFAACRPVRTHAQAPGPV